MYCYQIADDNNFEGRWTYNDVKFSPVLIIAVIRVLTLMPLSIGPEIPRVKWILYIPPCNTRTVMHDKPDKIDRQTLRDNLIHLQEKEN